MDFQAFRQAADAEAAALQIREYELYYQLKESASASVFRHEISEVSSASEGGVCLRCLVNGKMGYASTQLLSEESARALVRRAVENASVLETSEPEFLVEGGQNYQSTAANTAPLPDVTTIRGTALAGQDALYAQPGVVDGCGTEVFAQRICIAIHNSKGLDLQYENTVSGAFLNAIVNDGNPDGEKASNYRFRIGALDKLDLSTAASEAANEARESLGAGEVVSKPWIW